MVVLGKLVMGSWLCSRCQGCALCSTEGHELGGEICESATERALGCSNKGCILHTEGPVH